VIIGDCPSWQCRCKWRGKPIRQIAECRRCMICDAKRPYWADAEMKNRPIAPADIEAAKADLIRERV